MQQDPFQEFASPYVGMGINPINNSDPSGGETLPFFNVAVSGLSTTAETAITLGEVILVSVNRVLPVASKGLSITNKVSILVNSVFIVEKVLNKGTLTNNVGRITTDAGHGVKVGKRTDNGAISESTKDTEAELALILEEKTAAWLTIFGEDVNRTRTQNPKEANDKFSWRYKSANEHKSDVFVSFHLDSYTKEKTSSKIIYQQNNHNTTESIKLGNSIAPFLDQVMKTNKRPVQSMEEQGRDDVKNLAVLRGFKGKAGVLIEFGNIQNDGNIENVKNNSTQIGFYVALGIYKYIHGEIWSAFQHLFFR